MFYCRICGGELVLSEITRALLKNVFIVSEVNDCWKVEVDPLFEDKDVLIDQHMIGEDLLLDQEEIRKIRKTEESSRLVQSKTDGCPYFVLQYCWKGNTVVATWHGMEIYGPKKQAFELPAGWTCEINRDETISTVRFSEGDKKNFKLVVEADERFFLSDEEG